MNSQRDHHQDQLPPCTLMFYSIVIPIQTKNCFTAADWSPDNTIYYFLCYSSSLSYFFLSSFLPPYLSCSLIYPEHLKFYLKIKYIWYLFAKLDNFLQIELISNTPDSGDAFSASSLDFRDVDEVLVEVVELLSTFKIVKVRHLLKSTLIKKILLFFSYVLLRKLFLKRYNVAFIILLDANISSQNKLKKYQFPLPRNFFFLLGVLSASTSSPSSSKYFFSPP